MAFHPDPRPIVPHVITPQQAADALGLGVDEIAANLTAAAERKLCELGRQIDNHELSDLDVFDHQVAGIRNTVESALACWQAYDEAQP